MSPLKLIILKALSKGPYQTSRYFSSYFSYPLLRKSYQARTLFSIFLESSASRWSLSGTVRNYAGPPDPGECGPTVIDYRSILQEDEFHKLADSTLSDLLEKFEDFGDRIEIDGFDVDYGNQVLTLKLGSLGTYVLNKQTPNRQIWLSSPLSGPSRFDWDKDSGSWVYRRNKAKLGQLLEGELSQLSGQAIALS